MGTFYESRAHRHNNYNAEEEAVVFMALAYECVRLGIRCDGCTAREHMQVYPVDADELNRRSSETEKCRPSVLHPTAESHPTKYLTEVPRKKSMNSARPARETCAQCVTLHVWPVCATTWGTTEECKYAPNMTWEITSTSGNSTPTRKRGQ